MPFGSSARTHFSASFFVFSSAFCIVSRQRKTAVLNAMMLNIEEGGSFSIAFFSSCLATSIFGPLRISSGGGGGGGASFSPGVIGPSGGFHFSAGLLVLRRLLHRARRCR